jgi:hypothetical protein
VCMLWSDSKSDIKERGVNGMMAKFSASCNLVGLRIYT